MPNTLMCVYGCMFCMLLQLVACVSVLGCPAGYTGGNFIGSYSTTACDRFVALITWKPSFVSVSTRANAGVGTLPTYDALGGPNGKGCVTFDRTLLQYLDSGS